MTIFMGAAFIKGKREAFGQLRRCSRTGRGGRKLLTFLGLSMMVAAIVKTRVRREEGRRKKTRDARILTTD